MSTSYHSEVCLCFVNQNCKPMMTEKSCMKFFLMRIFFIKFCIKTERKSMILFTSMSCITKHSIIYLKMEGQNQKEWQKQRLKQRFMICHQFKLSKFSVHQILHCDFLNLKYIHIYGLTDIHNFIYILFQFLIISPLVQLYLIFVFCTLIYRKPFNYLLIIDVLLLPCTTAKTKMWFKLL